MQDHLAPVTAPIRIEHRALLADDQKGIVSKVEVGQIVGRILTQTPGTDARDLTVQPTASENSLALIQLGNNLELKDRNIIATARGNFRLVNGQLSVEPLLELQADKIDAKAPVDFAGDVTVRGGISDGFLLSSTGSLIVGGAIEAAQLKVMGSVHVKGGIIGKNKGTCSIGGDLWCRFLSHTRIVAGGNVHVQGEATNSYVQSAGRVTVEGGPVCGGKIAANGGLVCKVIGNAGGIPTIVEVGTDDSLRSIITTAKPEIEANRKRVKDIREKIQPLLKHLKSLTPQQRERATELLYEADELEAQTDGRSAELSARCGSVLKKSCAEIVVSETMFQGVTIRFSGAAAVIPTALKGPFKIVLRKSGTISEIVLIENVDRAGCILESHSTDNQIDMFIERLAAKKAA